MAKSSLTLRFSLILVCSILALLLLRGADAALGGGGGGVRVGGREKIPDVKHNKEIQDLGKFSVDEFNKDPLKYQPKGGNKSGVAPVTFKAVVDGEQQVVSGIKYYLKISAYTSSGVPKIFDAEVVVQAWKKAQPRELLTFSPSPPTK